VKTTAEIYEVILATARRQAETSAQGKMIRAALTIAVESGDIGADDLDMLLALICGNIANLVTFTSDVDIMKDEINMLADQCSASGDVSAPWVAKQLRRIVGLR
jgi:hypothetical protein